MESYLPVVGSDGSVEGAQSQNERLHSDNGAFDQSGIVGQSSGLGNKSQTFFNNIAAPRVMGVVKAPDRLRARFLELVERWPLGH